MGEWGLLGAVGRGSGVGEGWVGGGWGGRGLTGWLDGGWVGGLVDVRWDWFGWWSGKSQITRISVA